MLSIVTLVLAAGFVMESATLRTAPQPVKAIPVIVPMPHARRLQPFQLWLLTLPRDLTPEKSFVLCELWPAPLYCWFLLVLIECVEHVLMQADSLSHYYEVLGEEVECLACVRRRCAHKPAVTLETLQCHHLCQDDAREIGGGMHA